MHGLLQQFETIAARFGLLQQIAGLRLAGEQDDLARGHCVGDVYGQVDARHARHHDVADEDVGRYQHRLLQRFFRAVHSLGVMSVRLQDYRKTIRNYGVIVNNQNSKGLSACNH